jgi:hypothetical protein
MNLMTLKFKFCNAGIHFHPHAARMLRHPGITPRNREDYRKVSKTNQEIQRPMAGIAGPAGKAGIKSKRSGQKDKSRPADFAVANERTDSSQQLNERLQELTARNPEPGRN